MSATLVSSNTTIKVNVGVNGANALAGSGTLYTAPANGYAIVHLTKTTTLGNITYSIAGRVIFTTGTAVLAASQAYYVGPSQSVSWSSSVPGENANTIFAVGVEFINTP